MNRSLSSQSRIQGDVIGVIDVGQWGVGGRRGMQSGERRGLWSEVFPCSNSELGHIAVLGVLSLMENGGGVYF